MGGMRGVVEGLGSGTSARAGGEGGGTPRHKSREENEQKQTQEVQARKVRQRRGASVSIFLSAFLQNPVWNQKFRFMINDGHFYLNVCVWEKLLDERGDLLIGHVSREIIQTTTFDLDYYGLLICRLLQIAGLL
jgi:hypothetical protein